MAKLSKREEAKLMKDPDYAFQVKEGIQEDKNYRSMPKSKRSTSDGYMPRKLEVKHENTEKDSARLKASKTTKRGETRMGGQGAKSM